MAESTKDVGVEASAAEHACQITRSLPESFSGLAALTLVEYYYASVFKSSFVDSFAGSCSLVAWVKAGMVGWYFMHLKFEGKRVYVLIVPATHPRHDDCFCPSLPDMVLKARDRGKSW